MQCPFCKELDKDRVIDSRPTDSGQSIRRRRICEACGRRFTTRERIDESVRLSVVKKDGTRVAYDRNKMLAGLQRACWKRPVAAEVLAKIVDETEEDIFREHEREVSAGDIGRSLARRLLAVDKIAYLRYASVQEEFQNIDDFISAASDVAQRARQESPGQQDLFK